MRVRSSRRIVFDLIFLLFHIGKWIAGLYVGIGFYQSMPNAFWAVVFLYLGAYIIQDLYRVLKAIIKDTTLDNLDLEGDFSYVKGINPKDLTSAKTQILVYLAIFIIGVVGIVNNVNAWKDDGQNRLGNIAMLTLFAAAPVIVVIGEARKKN